MGSSSLKILLPQQISHYKILHLFSFVGYSPEPRISRLLRGLCGASSHNWRFFVYCASIIHYRFSSFASLIPCISAVLPVPRVLWAIATEMPLFMACVTLNFAYVFLSSSSSSSLHKSSSRCVSSSRHRCWVHFFTSSDSSSRPSCRCCNATTGVIV